jgi:protein-tyrosine-phosphatase
MGEKKTILFICAGNSACSQMAVGLVNNSYNNHYDAYSAGIYTSQPSPYAVKTMQESRL